MSGPDVGEGINFCRFSCACGHQVVAILQKSNKEITAVATIFVGYGFLPHQVQDSSFTNAY